VCDEFYCKREHIENTRWNKSIVQRRPGNHTVDSISVPPVYTVEPSTLSHGCVSASLTVIRAVASTTSKRLIKSFACVSRTRFCRRRIERRAQTFMRHLLNACEPTSQLTFDEMSDQNSSGNPNTPPLICESQGGMLAGTYPRSAKQNHGRMRQRRHRRGSSTCSFSSLPRPPSCGKKGGNPTSSVYTSTPKDHASASHCTMPADSTCTHAR
jgi:hypothetical protein